MGADSQRSLSSGTDSAPVNTTPPVIAGTAHDGQTLTAAPGSWSGTEPIAYAYQWRRCDGAGLDCADIDGATAQTYVLVSADVGSTIQVTVSASNAVGRRSATSEPTKPVDAAPPKNTVVPSISGIARQGQTLIVGGGAWSGTEPIGYAYEWRRCDLTKLNCVSIAGATGESYRLTAADVGATIRVREIASNVAGATVAASSATAVVSPPCPPFEGKQQAGTVGFAEAVELSGVAASRRTAGVLWTHNDSGDTERVFAIDRTGALLGRYSVSDNPQGDWEDIAVGPGPVAGVSYLYVGNIGANHGRHWLSVYRAPEPEVAVGRAPVSVSLKSVVKLRMAYPGVEEYNAETLLVDPQTHDLYVVTKSGSGRANVFQYPAGDQDPAITYVLKRVGTLQLPGPATAGDISPDGREIAIKGGTYSKLWPRALSVPIALALTPTPCWIPNGGGEAIGFAADGSGYFTVAEGAFQPLYWFARRQR